MRSEPRPRSIFDSEDAQACVRVFDGSAAPMRDPRADSRSFRRSERSAALLAGNFQVGTTMGRPLSSLSGWARKYSRTSVYIRWNGSGFEAPEHTW